MKGWARLVDQTLRPIKEYSYHRTNRSGEWSKGKVYQAKRHNYGRAVGPLELFGIDADFIVSETFEYAGRSGRVSKRDTRVSLGGATNGFTQGFTYNELGLLEQLHYPRCLSPACTSGTDPPRTINHVYDQGRLVEVTNWGTLRYHPNGQLDRLSHTNGVTDNHWLDPRNISRPRRIHFSGPQVNWTLGGGDYLYDGAGNVKTIGNDRYQYDNLGRLKKATLASAGNQTQELVYGRYGNVLEVIKNGVTTNISVQAASNHLSAPAVYDGAGNLLSHDMGGTPMVFTYDAINMVQTVQTPEVANAYLYTAANERILEFDFTQSPLVDTWTIRDLDGRALRQWRHTSSPGSGESWSWRQDYIYRGAQLLATVHAAEGVRHFHLDHLGTPRLLTDASGAEVSRHTYFPFGEEATNPNQSTEQMQFTGHERDKNGPGTGDDLDYMHARYYSPGICRFLSVDPARSARPSQPQSWNRYVYGLNNPALYTDPDGRESLAALRLEADIQAVSQGRMSAQNFHERNRARAEGAFAGLGLIDGALGARALVGAVRGGLGRSIGARLEQADEFLRGLFRRGNKVSGRAPRSVPGEINNPLQGTNYSGKVRQQMRPHQRTGTPDNHGFPLEVDNFAGQGTARQIAGRDGVIRTKVELSGSYRGKDGTFEWIIEPDGTINHRLFIPGP